MEGKLGTSGVGASGYFSGINARLQPRAEAAGPSGGREGWGREDAPQTLRETGL